MRLSTLLFLSGALLLPAAAVAADMAPDFTLPDLDGNKFKLAEHLKQGPVLLDFWATWCKPCIEELPMLDKVHQTYGPQGLQVIAISIDNPKSSAKVKPYTKGAGFGFSVLLDTDSEVRRLFGGSTMPFTALISPSGEIVYKHLGYVPGDEKALEDQVISLLKTLKPADTLKTAPAIPATPPPAGDQPK